MGDLLVALVILVFVHSVQLFLSGTLFSSSYSRLNYSGWVGGGWMDIGPTEVELELVLSSATSLLVI